MRVCRPVTLAIGALAVGCVAHWSAPLEAATVTLMSGLTYQGKVAVDNGLVITPESGPTVKVDFPSIFRAQFTDDAPIDDIIQPGAVLRNGVRLAGTFSSLSEPTVRFGKRNIAVPTQEIAWVIYHPLPASLTGNIPPGATGALLAGGDFFDGAVKSAEPDAFKVLSPIFGLRTFRSNQKDALAAILQEVKPPPASMFDVRTADGFSFGAESLTGDHAALSLRAGLLGTMRLDVKDLVEIRAGAARYQSLAALRPTRLTAPPGQTGVPAFEIDKTLSKEPLSGTGAAIFHGISAGTGVIAAWDLPPGFASFLAQVGLPAGSDPGTQLAFAVYADGKQVFRSPPVSVAAGNTGSGIWIEPILLRR